MVAQVADRLGADAAGPHVTVRGNLRRGYPGQAGDDLALLRQRALDDIVVAVAKGLCDAGHAAELGLADLLLQALDDGLILLDGRRDAHTDGIQLDALFRDFADELVGLQLVMYEVVNVVELIDVEVRDDRMDAQREVLVARLE